MFRLYLCVLSLVLVRVIRMIPCLPQLSFVKRNRKHLRRMARRCNYLSRPLALLSWTMRVCFAFMRMVDMFCGFQILTSSCKCA